VHHFVSEVHLLRSRLTNYWGYNTVGFFAPHARYSATGSRGGQVSEFKEMVKALHEAGLEVVIDVVYNHTAEGGIDGPTLSFRGIGNDDYYYLTDGGRQYVDYTGCGNSLDASHPHVLQMILDSLRYWATEMHVDGFRFDLTSTLARSLNDVNMLGNFMTAIAQDPVLRRLKLIAEPWDVGPGGYRVGEFPVLWAEWNDRFRDTTRGFWRGDIELSDLGYRLTGSADLYAPDGRRPFSSINFVTAHDQDNGEDNRDGTDNNISANYGHEGETDDPAINETRHRQMRNMLVTCVLSSGVPMLSGGDEIGRTQRGNNNAYCQDNEISWYDWDLEQWQTDLLHFTRELIALRRTNPAFRQRHFYVAADAAGAAADQPTDITWWHPNGRVFSHEDWNDIEQRCLGMIVANRPSNSQAGAGSGCNTDAGRFLVAMNAGADAVDFRLPETFADAVIALHTTKSPPALAHAVVHLPGRSSIVLTHP
jgi:glycogen operon protein